MREVGTVGMIGLLRGMGWKEKGACCASENIFSSNRGCSVALANLEGFLFGIEIVK